MNQKNKNLPEPNRLAMGIVFLIIASLALTVYTFTTNKSSRLPTSSPSPSSTPIPTLAPYYLDMTIPTWWQKYSNPERTFTIAYPSTWKQSKVTTERDGSYYVKRITINGPEGSVDIAWTNDGYGGICPLEFSAQIITPKNTFKMCRNIRENGQEYFGQIYKETTIGNAIHVWTYASALVSMPIEANREVVLAILTSIVFK